MSGPSELETEGRPPIPPGAAGMGLAVDERIRLMRDGVFNNASVIASGVIGIILVPIMLRGLGAEAYGVWIAALSLVGVVALCDFGLGLTVTREVAASLGRAGRGEAAEFVKAAQNAYFLLGVSGAVVIVAVGLPVAKGLHLSPANLKTAPAVFVLAGVAFLAERLLSFTTAELRGLRRFDASNALAISMAIWRACGIIALLKLGAGLVAVMTWQAVATAAAAWAGQAFVGGLEPEFRFGLGHLDWPVLRAHLPFGLASQLTTIAEIMMWQLAPVVVGLVLGSGWIAPYYIAQKFPLALGPIIWSTAEALFPAVSQHQSDAEITRTREIIEVGTRWTLVVALPPCLVLTSIAPELLHTWVGEIQPEAVLVLRLITLAVFICGAAAASTQILWGRGEVRTLIIVSGLLAAASLGLGWVLLSRLGMAGAAWGLLLPMTAASAAYLAIASRICRIRLIDLAAKACEGLLLPVLACLAATIALKHLCSTGWAGIIATSLGGGIAYLAGFCYTRARTEETSFLRKLAALPVGYMRPGFVRLCNSFSRLGSQKRG